MNIVKYIKNNGIKRILEVIYKYKIQLILNKLFYIVYKNKPLKNFIVIESHNDFDMNGGAFYDYLIKNKYNEKYVIIWILRNKLDRKLPNNVRCVYQFKPSLKLAYYYNRAKFITFDHQVLGSLREDQTSIYLTHGPIGLKAFKNKLFLPNSLTYMLLPSNYLAPILASQYQLEYPNDKFKILGYPMHDVFYNSNPGDLEKITKKNFKKVVLWMPTFRKSVDFNRNDSSTELPLGVPILQSVGMCEKINNFLKINNSLLIVKIHPMQDLQTVKIKDMSNILVIDAQAVKDLNLDNYRLMKDVDALISDYSSAAYDFLHVDKPLAFTLDDAEEYKLGFIFKDPINYMPGHIVYNQEDFINFIKDILDEKDIYKEKRKEVFDLFFKYHDGNSSHRLAEFLDL